MKGCFKFAFLPLKSGNLGIWGVKIMWVLTFTSLNLISKVNSRSNPHGVRYTVEETPEVLPVTWVVWGWEMDCPWDGREQQQAGSSFRNYSFWKEVGLEEVDNAGCSHGDAWRQTFALFHKQKVVVSGTTPVELGITQTLHTLLELASFQTPRNEASTKDQGERDSFCAEDTAGDFSCLGSSPPGPLCWDGLCFCFKSSTWKDRAFLKLFFFLPVLLRYNWPKALYKFEYSIMI